MDTDTNLSKTDKLWLSLRKNNHFYALNKIISVVISFGLAAYTLSYKRMFFQYSKINPTAENLDAYAFVYWLLFIYYGFHGIDELIEMYAVFAQRERGALGLLFEMNYFLGVGVAIYIMWFVKSGYATITNEAFKGL